jgi:hypothetical protein
VEVPAGIQATIFQRHQAHFPAEKLAQQDPSLKRFALVSVEPGLDLPPIGFCGARQHGQDLRRLLGDRVLVLQLAA